MNQNWRPNNPNNQNRTTNIPNTRTTIITDPKTGRPVQVQTYPQGNQPQNASMRATNTIGRTQTNTHSLAPQTAVLRTNSLVPAQQRNTNGLLVPVAPQYGTTNQQPIRRNEILEELQLRKIAAEETSKSNKILFWIFVTIIILASIAGIILLSLWGAGIFPPQ
ncbi:MMOB5430 family gliding machinery internal complex protein [[Mycoplasma] mobile]|uniref:Expressed protein n=1 Tax=Mycoplasma mobile (strain ATCC 43663 / 163K / NCTC 11711) TaxID=267748 RepID=Q6KHA1_MYCM1|nr:hypothetical protein [[Mycoplasma] mobile]AAT28029.1 expressed protein [Mycoplasma mobile 163K]